MFLAATCPSCQKRLKYSEELVGRKVRCPACRATFRVSDEGNSTRPEVVPAAPGYPTSPPSQQHLVIGRNFTIGKGLLKGKPYIGPVIASRDAFYLLPTMSAYAAGLGAAFGAVGGAVAGLVAATVAKRKSYPLGTTFEQLPDEVQDAPGWPRVAPTCPVIVIPRSAVTKLVYSFWGATTVETEEHSFRLELSIFRRRKVLRFLRKSGWEV